MKVIRNKKGFIKTTIVIISLFFSSLATSQTNSPISKELVKAVESLEWITEEYPPFNYTDPATGKLTGIAVEALEKIFSSLGVSGQNAQLKVYPWARGYHKVLNDPGSVLFSTTYTEHRLQKMKFVGPIAPNIVAVIAPKSKALSIESYEDLNKLKIGVVRDDIGEQLLLEQGVVPDAIDQLNTGLSMVKKLAAGRVDAVGYAHATTELLFKDANINPKDYEIIHVLKKSDMGYAFHNGTDEKILTLLQTALQELISDGTLEDLHNKYNLEFTYE